MVALTSVGANVAKIGDTEYATLPAAVAAAPSGTQTTIELLGDVNEGPGIFLAAADGKDLVIDFKGYKYDVQDLVGSPGTKTQAWHLEKGNKVHLKNGTLTTAGAKILVQNYCLLTLTDMNIQGGDSKYAVSNNCGECNILGSTSITAAEGKVAFDVCNAAAYPSGVKVTVNTTGTITGKIEYGTWPEDVSSPYSSLLIEGGTFDGEIVIDGTFVTGAPDITIKGGNFNYEVPAEYIADDAAPLGGLKLEVDPTKWEMQLELVDGKASADKAFDVTLTNIAAYSAKIEGANKDNFTWNDKKELVKFNATAAGTYKATLVFSAKGVADVNVPLEITVKAPELSVSPLSWEGEKLMIKNGKAEAEKAFSIIGSYLQGDVEIKIKGTDSKFEWNGTKKAVTFLSRETGTFSDKLVVSTPGLDPIEIPLSIEVSRPVITVADKVEFGNVTLMDAMKGQTKETPVSVSPEEKLSVAVTSDVFSAKIEGGKLIVTLKSDAAGTYAATATINGVDANPVEVALTATVKMPDPDLSVLPSEWKETIKLENGVAKAERQISISALFAFSYPSFTWWKGNEGFAWDNENSKITFEADAEDTYTDTLYVSVSGADGKKVTKSVALEIKVEKGGDTPEIHVTGVTLNKTSDELAIGGTLQLEATITPSDATEKAVTWESSNPAVATVSATGLVTAVAKGSATITVTTKDSGKTATCAITVKEEVVPPTPGGDAFTLVTDASTLQAGMELIIVSTENKVAAGQWNSKNKYLETANVTIENNTIVLAENSTAIIFTLGGNSGAWTLTNPEGKLLSSGAAKSVAWDGQNNKWTISIANGDATIKCGSNGWIQYNANNPRFTTYTTTQVSPQIYARTAAPVVDVDVTGVTLNKQTASIEAGKSETLTATVAPENATNKKVTWSSSNEAVATVSAEGVVKAVAEGTATITVKTEQGGFEAKCVVTVTPSTTPIVKVTGVELDKDSYEIMEGLTVELKATVKPADATNQEVTWSSSDETVATVENGLVTTLQPGTVTITVKTVDGDFTDECVITVNRETPPLPSEVVFTKVTADQADWSGQYLLVYEMSATEALVFNGKDAKEGEGCVVATLANGTIILEDYAKYCIYVEKMEGGYSLKIGDSYLSGGIGEKNGITFSDKPVLNTIKQYNADSLELVSNGFYMRFNKDVKEMRFRYFKAASYHLQQKVFLYKADQEITPQPADTPDTISVAEAIRVCSEEKVHYVMGIVGEIQTTDDKLAQYHNLDFMLADIDDPSKQIKCYRLWWQKMNGEFNGGEIATGDTILVYGQTSIYTDKDKNKIDEIVNGYVVEILGKGDGTGPVDPTPHGEPIDIDYADVYYIADDVPYWFLNAGKYPEDETQEYLDYPILQLFIQNTDDKHIAGTYNIYEGYLYLSDNDSVEVVGGSVHVECLEAGNELYLPYYRFVVTLIDAEGNEYVYEFETEVGSYDEMGEEIVLDDQPTQGIENTVVWEFDPNAPIYNIQGMQVDRNTRGILIQNGHKFIINGL